LLDCIVIDAIRSVIGFVFFRRIAFVAENLFLRRQLAMYVERGVKPRRPRRGDRLLLAVTSRLFRWREALIVVKPATLICWQRAGVRLLWRWKSRRSGRRPIPAELRALIERMARENPAWAARRIGNELKLKLGLTVSPRTVRNVLGPRPRRSRRYDQRWSTFVRNHVNAIVACDFVVSTTLALRTVYTFVMIEAGSRRIVHTATTSHPTAAWTTQQLRNALPGDHDYRYLLHDRDSIFSADLDSAMGRLGIKILKSPPRCPKANAFCERVIGTLRRECLDWIIPLTENQIGSVVREWVAHYNRGRPHMALGPGIPDAPDGLPVQLQNHRHRLPDGVRVASTPVLAGLHHEYRLDRAA
jgi:transposase InsO family protein